MWQTVSVRSGIGGGFFMLIYQRETRKVIAIDARETAPSRAFETMFSKDPLLSFEGFLWCLKKSLGTLLKLVGY
jgi:gamma-glutamyltranspeptidase